MNYQTSIFDLSLFFVAIISQILLIINYKSLKKSIGIKSYESIQKIHNDDTPRFGGISLFIVFFIFILINSNKISLGNTNIIHILTISVPLILLILFEDFHIHISPKLRIFVSFVTSLIAVFLLKDHLPIINLPLTDVTLGNNYLLLFYAFAITSILNGFNMIDGLNGLLSIVCISMLFSLFMVSGSFGLTNLSTLCKYLMIISLSIFILNFPKGLIFNGDVGSFFFGFLISLITIVITYKTQSNPYSAILLLLYPCTEVIFSVSRRLILKSQATIADLNHLHSLVYKIVLMKKNKNLQANYISSILMIPFAISPSILFLFFNNHTIMIYVSIMCYITIYIITYTYLYIKINN